VLSGITTDFVLNRFAQTGAGISTSAGIPDFRSPDTGLYANLARLDLPYAEAVFDINYFKQNPYPFYMLAHELYPGKYRPTVTHSFVNLLHKKGLLLKLFTQNIDCLEREAGVPGDKIVEAHGSFATQRCVECGTEYPDDKMREVIKNKEVPHCLSGTCGGLVKPDIVFFGEQLPAAFFASRTLPAHADLAIVMGTSLTVQPFASLPSFVSEGTPRVLINLEQVGSLGSRPDDVLILKKCDDGVRELAAACGWLEELEEMWAATGTRYVIPLAEKPKDEKPKSPDEVLEEEVAKLTKEVEESLKITESHKDRTEKELKGTAPEKAEDNARGRQKEQIEKDVTEGQGRETSPTAPLYRPQHEEGTGGGGDLAHIFPHLKSKSSL
jgi:NAD+-dependent protein deacetylase SIR2